jgi:hypothetical protein
MASHLASAEKIDNYRRRCAASTYNATARNDHIYEPFFVDKPTAEYMESVAVATPLLHRAKIIVMNPSADGGYPHTRPGNLICMPANACKSDYCRTTLIHEAIHLHQREFLNEWIGFCMKEGWTQQFRSPPLVERVRINPDTMMCPFWSWQEHYLPLPLFIDKPRANISDVDIKWLDLRMGSITTPPPSFVRLWGDAPQPEHPFELYAVKLADTCKTDDDVFKVIRS